KSLLHAKSVVVHMTPSTAWKFSSKLLLIMRPRIPTKQEGDDGDVMFIAFIRRYDDSHDEGPKDEKNERIEVLEVE
nr:hypothetical protein [Tanacetum cinerariifolium]